MNGCNQLVWSISRLLLICSAVGVAGCEIYPWFYPRFDNPLNPDIEFIATGDVVQGVKCAVTSYLWERSAKVLNRARADNQVAPRCYAPTQAQLARKQGWKIDYLHFDDTGGDKFTSEDCVGKRPQDFDEHGKLKKSGVPRPGSDARSGSSKASEGIGKPQCKPIASAALPPPVRRMIGVLAAFPSDSKQASNKFKGLSADDKEWAKCLRHWVDYTGACAPAQAYLFEQKLFEQKKCVPNGGCPPGTIRGKKLCLINEPDRFALDSQSNATIELMLTANNTGTINFNRIDLATVGRPLTDIFYPASLTASGTTSGLVSAPLVPSLTVKPKASNIVTTQFEIPQTPYIAEAEQPDDIKSEVDTANNAAKTYLRLVNDFEILVGAPEVRPAMFEGLLPAAVRRPEAADQTRYTTQALKALAATAAFDTYEAAQKSIAELESHCGRKVDFLALRSFIEKAVNDQETAVFKGAPEVSLDSIVLTSSFQIYLEANASTHLFHIMPMLQPPGLDLNPDHTHQIKLTFHGVKSRGNPANGVSLKEKCITRLQGIATEGSAESDCNKSEALLLESVIDSVGNRKGRRVCWIWSLA